MKLSMLGRFVSLTPFFFCLLMVVETVAGYEIFLLVVCKLSYWKVASQDQLGHFLKFFLAGMQLCLQQGVSSVCSRVLVAHMPVHWSWNMGHHWRTCSTVCSPDREVKGPFSCCNLRRFGSYPSCMSLLMCCLLYRCPLLSCLVDSLSKACFSWMEDLGIEHRFPWFSQLPRWPSG